MSMNVKKEIHVGITRNVAMILLVLLVPALLGLQWAVKTTARVSVQEFGIYFLMQLTSSASSVRWTACFQSKCLWEKGWLCQQIWTWWVSPNRYQTLNQSSAKMEGLTLCDHRMCFGEILHQFWWNWLSPWKSPRKKLWRLVSFGFTHNSDFGLQACFLKCTHHDMNF